MRIEQTLRARGFICLTRLMSVRSTIGRRFIKRSHESSVFAAVIIDVAVIKDVVFPCCGLFKLWWCWCAGLDRILPQPDLRCCLWSGRD